MARFTGETIKGHAKSILNLEIWNQWKLERIRGLYRKLELMNNSG